MNCTHCRHNYEAYLFEYIQWLGYDEDGLYGLYEKQLAGYMVRDYYTQQDEDLIEEPDVLNTVDAHIRQPLCI